MGVGEAYDALRASGEVSQLRRNEPMYRHTTFRIGGPAAIYAVCDTLEQLALVLDVARECAVPWSIVGKGSNLLVSDEGYSGIAISLGRDFKTFRLERSDHRGEEDDGSPQEPSDPDTSAILTSAGNVVEPGADPGDGRGDPDIMVCGAGMSLGRLVSEACRLGYSGFEFAVGIPGSFGGAMFMNAGTPEATIGSVTRSVVVYRPGEGLHRYMGEDLPWVYRYSGIPKGEVILEAQIRVHKTSKSYLQARMEASLDRRRKTQPSGYPNAGSIFRNPVGDSAGRLIEAAGLKGTRIGGAQISEVHANFIVNVDNATAQDVLRLMTLARDKVKDLYGIELQPETKFLGFS